MKKVLSYILVILCIFITFYVVKKLNVYFSDFSGKKTVIKFSSWGSQSEVTILKNIIKEYENENPDIKIEFIHVPQNYFQKIHLLFASGLEPDVIFVNNRYIQMYIKAGLLENLTPYIIKDQTNYYNEALDCFSYEGKIYAIPRDISNLVIYYNKDIFKKEKISVPKKIKNINELKELAEKLTNSYHYGINTEDTDLYWLYFLSAQGTGALSDDKKNIIINSEKSINALNLYSDFSNKYNISPTKAQIGSMTTAQMFVNKKLAMYVSGRWMVPKFREAVNFDWDIMEFPSSNENRLYIDASGWAVSKKSKNKQAAIDFVKYLSSQSSIEKLTSTGLIIPARKDIAQSNIFLDKTKKPFHSEIFLNSLQYSKPTPVNENYPEINDILNEKALLIINNKHGAKEVFDEKTIKKLESLL